MQILGKTEDVTSMTEVSSVMYDNLKLPHMQMWGCIALEAIMARIRENAHKVRTLQQRLQGPAEGNRVSIEFAMDKVLISLHTHAGNQEISKHACSLMLEVHLILSLQKYHDTRLIL